MDSINQTDVLAYYEHLRDLISKNSQLNLQTFAVDLLNSKVNKLPERESKDCQLQYKVDNLEIKIWSLALLSMSWIIEILKQKTQHGHCRNIEHRHGKREPRNCPLGYDFHMQMYKDCLSSFIDLINTAEENPPKVLTNSE